MPNDEPYDDQTEIASPTGKRKKKKKFIESETQLKTEIYQGDPAKKPLPKIPPAKVSASSPALAVGTPPPRGAEDDDKPAPELQARVEHVFSVAESLLADLGDGTQTDVTMPGSLRARGGSSERSETEDEEAKERAITEVEDIEEPPGLPVGPKHALDRSIETTGESHSIGTAPTDISDLPGSDTDDDLPAAPRQADEATAPVALPTPPPTPSPSAGPGDETTQVEAAPPAELTSPEGGPTLPGHPGVAGAPLSDQPFAPGPMSPLAVSPEHSGDDLNTITTEDPPARGPATSMAPARFQAAPTEPPRRGFMGMWDSLMRFFGRRPPPPPPPPMDDDGDFSSYGRGTYTHANRLVARSGKRYTDD